MAYVVTAPAVAVSVPAGPRVSHVKFVEAGSLLPEGVDEAAITHLLSMGMIAAVESAEAAPPDDGEPAAKAVEDMTVEELKAYADEHGIDLADAKLKADILTAIQAATAATD